MAQFQPFNFNNQLDMSQLGKYGQQQPELLGNIPIGGGTAQGAAGASASTPGNIFSSLFGDNGMFSRSSMLGGTDQKTGMSSTGWAPAALGIGQAIFGGMQGQKAMTMAQDQLKEGKRQFDLNYGNQVQSTNTALEDRQRARVASNPNAYQSVSEYMDKNRVK